MSGDRRYENFYGIPITAKQAESQITKRFPGCNRVKNLTALERKRDKKYNGTTLYFRELIFTFIVQDAILKSAEISAKGKRGLNKCKITAEEKRVEITTTTI